MAPATKSLLTSLFAAQEYLARGLRQDANDEIYFAWIMSFLCRHPTDVMLRLDALEMRCSRNANRDLNHDRERNLFFSIGDLIRDVLATSGDTTCQSLDTKSTPAKAG